MGTSSVCQRLLIVLKDYFSSSSHNGNELAKTEWIHFGLDKLVDALSLSAVTKCLLP
jgi:hypothetical protein